MQSRNLVEQGPDEPVARALNQLTWISNALELLLLFEIERQADNLDVDLESLRDEVRAPGLKSFEDEMNKPNNPAPE